jgi:glutaredoxin-dependent peroxiredoxin
MALQEGTLAPDFTLKTKTADGLEDITLSSFRHQENVVLLFVPAAFTGVCTQEMCDVSGGVHALPGAKVIGISVDSPFAQEAWAKANNMQVTLVSDYGHSVTKAYDVVLENLAGLGGNASKRAAFVIDKDGVIRYSEETPTPLELPDFGKIQSVLATL